MKRLLLVLLMLWTTNVYAQPPYLAWDQYRTDGCGLVQDNDYKYFTDGSAVGILLFSVACVDTPGEIPTCQVPMPNFSEGNHTLDMTATNACGESPHSLPLAFTVGTPPRPAPTVSITANPFTVRKGSSSTIIWSSTDADTCIVDPTGWTGTSGSMNTGALTLQRTYTLTCWGNGSASASVTVKIKPGGRK